MTYALWVIGSANIVQAYDNERDALALVLRNLDRNSKETASTLALTVEDDNGHVTLIAQGQALVDRAQQMLSEHRLAH